MSDISLKDLRDSVDCFKKIKLLPSEDKYRIVAIRAMEHCILNIVLNSQPRGMVETTAEVRPQKRPV